jgi:phenylpropionate dioxygenase-like ring-hydroxylating dioxygenase large terminal subunit
VAFDKSEFCLVPVSVNTWNECVFVNPDPNAPSLVDAWGEFEQMANERGLLAGYRYQSSSTYDVSANWKVWVGERERVLPLPDGP